MMLILFPCVGVMAEAATALVARSRFLGTHERVSGAGIAGHAASEIPLGYGMYCLGYHFAAASYLAWCPKQWDVPARLNLRFWQKPA